MSRSVNCNILGVSAFYHDSAACLVRDGRIVAAASEERFTRIKGDASFPAKAIEYCLEEGQLSVDDLDYVGFYDKPLLKFERILETYLGIAPQGFRSFLKAGPLWIKDKLHTDRIVKESLDWRGPILYAEHHESHAASAFYPSPFEEAAILTVDGVGEWATASLGVGRGSEIHILRELHWPDSLGLLYSAFTYFTGFKVNSGEYKVMGLAPYGVARYKETILSKIMELNDDGSFRLHQEFFNYVGGLTMTNSRFAKLFDGPRREPESPLTQREMDLARSVQEVCEEVVLRMARSLHEETGLPNLCMAGGVALNCVANGRLLREGPFQNLWIQPAAGDAGGAIGIALLIWHRIVGSARTPEASDSMGTAYLGPMFSDAEIAEVLTQRGAVSEKLESQELIDRSARALAEEKVVGWFQGRMEFGPRALGNRSILGDARSPRMQSQMNLKIKFRESFRPFAPSVLEERAADYFGLDAESPYMLLVAPVAEERRVPLDDSVPALWGLDLLNSSRSDIPAVTHVDYSARVQTVSAARNLLYHGLIKRFDEMTGCGVIVNTSFNVRGEPLVCTPDDAYACFMRTDMDRLAIGSFFLEKERQPPWKEDDAWKNRFELD